MEDKHQVLARLDLIAKSIGSMAGTPNQQATQMGTNLRQFLDENNFSVAHVNVIWLRAYDRPIDDQDNNIAGAITEVETEIELYIEARKPVPEVPMISWGELPVKKPSSDRLFIPLVDGETVSLT